MEDEIEVESATVVLEACFGEAIGRLGEITSDLEDVTDAASWNCRASSESSSYFDRAPVGAC